MTKKRIQKTYHAKPNEIEKNWILVDAENQTLGRLATVVADVLRGKNKPTFTPATDAGDFVIVINAEKIEVTGQKETQKRYHSHSGFPGGYKSIQVKDLREKHPERLIMNAVKGMLPHNKLGSKLITKLKVYAGSEHNHEAQTPVKLELNG